MKKITNYLSNGGAEIVAIAIITFLCIIALVMTNYLALLESS